MGKNGFDDQSRSEINIRDVWAEYKKTGSEVLRNRLMEHYLHLVRLHAEKLHAKLPDYVEIDDLMSAGIFGLMDAIEGFDPERYIKFETYSAARIRGAILDELREMDWVPRLVRSRANKLETATQQLEIELGRAPRDDELQQRLCLTEKGYQAVVNDSRVIGVVSLSRKWYETDSNKEVREFDVVADKRSEDPAQAAVRHDLRNAMMSGLGRAARLTITLYHFEGFLMREVGQVVDLSESRISQMHTNAVGQIRSKDYLRELCEAD